MKHYFGATAVLPLSVMLIWSLSAAGQTSGRDELPKLETIVVTGTQGNMESARMEVELTPGGANLIDLEDFRNRNVSNLADVLRYVPGIWSSSDGGNDGIFFTSRGSNLDATDWDMNGIKLMQDGLPVTTADGNNHNRIIDPLSARYATVARGANGMKYGASTLGGAIDFVSRTAHDVAELDVSLASGSHGQALARASMSRVFNDRFDGLLTLEAKQWDGYRDHNEQDRVGVYGNAGWQLSETAQTRFYGAYLENDQALSGGLSRAQFDADPSQASGPAVGGNYQLDVKTLRLANKTSWLLGTDKSLELGFSVEEQALFHPIVDRIMVDFDGPGPAHPVEVFSLLIDTDHQDVGAVLRYRQQISDHDLLLGANYGVNSVDGEHYRNLNGMRNGLTTLVDNEARMVEAFAMDRWRLDSDLILIAAAQAVWADRAVRNTNANSGSVANPRDSYSRINPSLGIIYRAREDVDLYANVSRLFEAPTNFELEDNVAGSSATLRAMKGTVVEFGTRGSGRLGRDSRWSWDLSYYFAKVRDEILSVEDPNAPGTSLVTNVDATVHSGIETILSARFELAGNRSIEPVLSVTLNDFTFDDDAAYENNSLPAAPNHVVRGEIIYRGGRGLFAGPSFEFVGDRYADFVNSYKISSYMLLGFRAGWSNDTWTVFSELRNLTDEAYVANHSVRNNASVDDAILNPGEPRSVYFGIQRQFD